MKAPADVYHMMPVIVRAYRMMHVTVHVIVHAIVPVSATVLVTVLVTALACPVGSDNLPAVKNKERTARK